MLIINSVEKADRFVTEQKALGNDCYWENYDMVFFRPAPQAIYSRDGIFRNGEWGFKNMSPVTEKGTWEIEFRNVKKGRRR